MEIHSSNKENLRQNLEEIHQKKGFSSSGEKNYRTILNSIGDAVIVTDRNGVITSLNPVAEELTGWNESKALNKDLTDVFRIFDEESLIKSEDPVNKVLRENTSVGLSNHTVLINAKGEEIPIADSAAPIRDEEGNVSGVVLVFRDQSVERYHQRINNLRLKLFEYSKSHTLNELLVFMLDEVEKLSRSKISFYHFLQDDQETLSLQAWSSQTKKYFCKAYAEGFHYKVSEAGVWVDCIYQKKPVIHNDYSSLEHKKGMPEGHAEVVRELVVPVMRDNKIVAILGIGNKETDYTEKDSEHLSFIADVTWEIAEKKRIDEELVIQSNALSERLKELNCLYEISKLMTRKDILPGTFFQSIVNLIPPSWQYPDITCARIKYKDKDFTTDNFEETEWVQKTEFHDPAQTVGIIEVFQKREMPLAFEGPFLKEERELLNSIADHVDHFLNQYDTWKEKRKSEELRNALIQSSPTAILSLDLKGNVLTWNQAAERIFGWKAGEVIGKPLRVVPEDKKDEHLKLVKKVIGGEGFSALELIRQHKDGRLVDVRLSTAPIFDEERNIIGIMASIEDITDYKKVKNNLEYSEELLRDVGELANIGGWEFDPVTGEGSWTEQTAKIHDVDPGINKNMELGLKFYTSESRKKIQEAIQKAINEHKEYDLELELVTEKGVHKWVRTKGKPVLVNGKLVNIRGSFQDITEMKKVESIIRESRENLRITLNSIGDAFIATNVNGEITRMNVIAERLTGFTTEEARGLPLEKVFHIVNSKTGDEVENPVNKVLKHGKIVGLANHTKLISKTGKEYQISDSGAPIKDVNGCITGVILVFRDVTEEYRMHELLKVNEKKMSSIFRVAPIGIGLVKNRVLLEVNKYISDITGYSYEELINKNARLLYPNQKEYEYVGKEKYSQIKANRIGIVETKWKNKNGSVLDILLSSTPIEPENTDKGYIFTALNITDQKKFENEISESELRFRLLAESAPLGILISDKKERAIYINSYFTEIFGYNLNDVPSVEAWWPLAYPDKKYRTKVQSEWKTAIAEAQEKRSAMKPMEFAVRCKDGKIKEIEFRMASNGELNFIIFTDITKRKQLIGDLMVAKQKAEESDRLKSAFLANMSHEIRTPMNGILGFLDLLDNAGLPDEQRKKYLGIVNKSGERLLNTLNDIIEISKIESGPTELKMEHISLREILQHQYDFFLPEVRAKGLELILKIDCEGKDDLLIRTDINKFESIIINFLKNALKFTSSGRIEIGASLNNKNLITYVSDSGIGIPSDRLHTVFGRFVQADLSTTRPYEGSGLGLSISKAYAEMLGGSVHVESVENRGSKFFLLLPVEINPGF